MTREIYPCGYKFCQYSFNPEEEGFCKKCLIKPKERVLNPEIADFFWNCCERFKK